MEKLWDVLLAMASGDSVAGMMLVGIILIFAIGAIIAIIMAIRTIFGSFFSGVGSAADNVGKGAGELLSKSGDLPSGMGKFFEKLGDLPSRLGDMFAALPDGINSLLTNIGISHVQRAKNAEETFEGEVVMGAHKFSARGHGPMTAPATASMFGRFGEAIAGRFGGREETLPQGQSSQTPPLPGGKHLRKKN